MSFKAPVTTTSVVLAIALLGTGAVGSGYRRYSELDRRVIAAETAVAQKDARIAQLTGWLAGTRRELDFTHTELALTKKSLRTTQALLKEVGEEIRTAQETVTSQQADITSLKTCLAGTVQALNYVAASDQYRALYVMTSVDSECKRAQALFNEVLANR